MKNKTLSLLGAFAVFAILLVSFASATITLSNIPTLSKTGTSGSITVSSDQNETITFSGLSTINGNDAKTISFTIPSSVILNEANNRTASVTINYAVESGFEFEFGEEYSTTLTATGDVSTAVNQKLSFAETSFCSLGNTGDLELDLDTSIDVSGLGDDDEWYPLDKIEITVNVDNTGSEDIDDIVLSWCLYSESEGKCILDDEEKSFDLKDGKDVDKVISFTLDDPEDYDTDDEDYTFYVKAYSDDLGEDLECQSDSIGVTIVQDNFIVLDEDSLNIPETVSCGQDLMIDGEVWNIGDNDEENVYMEIVNSALGIKQEVNLGDIDSFDSKDFSATIKIPTNAKAQTYTLEFRIYDEDDDIYESGDVDAKFTKNIVIDGSCSTVPQVSIITNVEGDAKAGEELIVKATVLNQGTQSITLVLSASGYDDWAELSSVTPLSVTLDAGKSADVLISLNINDDVSGDKSLSVKATPITGDAVTQSVSVSIAKAGGFNWAGITGNVISSNNWYLWGIGALNVILVLVIIIVAIKVARS